MNRRRSTRRTRRAPSVWATITRPRPTSRVSKTSSRRLAVRDVDGDRPHEEDEHRHERRVVDREPARPPGLERGSQGDGRGHGMAGDEHVVHATTS